MRFILLSIVLLLFMPAFSQERNTQFKKLRLGISYSPAFSYRELKYSEQNKWLADLKNEEELPRYGYSYGVNLLYSVNEKFVIHAVILYSDKGEKTKPIALEWATNNTTLPIKSETTFHDHYLDLPLQLNYYLIREKIKWYVTAGIEANKFLFENSSLKLVYNDHSEKQKAAKHYYGLSEWSLSYIVGTGAELKLLHRISFQIEPSFRKNFTSVNVDKGSRQYFYSFSVNACLYYSFLQRKNNDKRR